MVHGGSPSGAKEKRLSEFYCSFTLINSFKMTGIYQKSGATDIAMENKKKSFNVFEGARRLAILVGILFISGCAIAAFNAPSTAYLHYSIHSPLSPPVMVDDCGASDKREYVGMDRVKGASITLCFPPSVSNSGEMLIPYKATEDGKSWWMGDKYSPAVSNYTEAFATSFRGSAKIEQDVASGLSKKRGEYWSATAKVLTFGLAGWWVIVFVIGWVARGFLSIPRGKDFRE